MGCRNISVSYDARVIVLLVSAAGILFGAESAVSKTKPRQAPVVSKLPFSEMQTTSQYTLNVSCQVIRSRAQSSLAGTVTENYQLDWTVLVHEQRIFIKSIYGSAEAHWDADESKAKVGRMTLMRSDLVRLLGLEQELPQEVLLWQPDLPVMVPVLERANRGLDQILRHGDDNGMLIIRLAVRI